MFDYLQMSQKKESPVFIILFYNFVRKSRQFLKGMLWIISSLLKEDSLLVGFSVRLHFDLSEELIEDNGIRLVQRGISDI